MAYGFTDSSAERSETVEHGLTIQVLVWTTPAEEPWDGDEPLEANAEGWDLWVEVRLAGFTGCAQVGGNWIMPNPDGIAFLKDNVEALQKEAIGELLDSIRAVAAGRDVETARAEQRRALDLVHMGKIAV